MSRWLSFKAKLNSKKAIIFNSFWVFTDKIIRMVGGLVVGIWFARYIGVYEFGVWNYAYSIVALAIPFINLGINNILLTELSKAVLTNEDRDRYIITGIVLKLLSGVLVTLGIVGYSYFLKDEAQTRTVLLILSFQCIFQAGNVFDLYYQSRTESKHSVKAKTSAYLFINVLKVFALLYHASLYVFAILTVLEVVTASGILLLFYTRLSKNAFPKWTLDPLIIKSLLLRSWPFLIAELLIIFYTRLDQIMIKNMIGNEELGRYSAAVRLSEIWYFIPGAISVSLYPTLVKLKAESEEALTMGFQKLFNILTAISLLLAVGATFLSEYVAMFLYGEEFKGVGTILSIHIWTGIAVFLGTGSGYWLVLHGLQKYSLIQTISGAVVNIALNFLLIPKYLGVGAAIATLVAQITATIISNALMSKTRPVFWLQLKALLNIFRPSIKNYI